MSNLSHIQDFIDSGKLEQYVVGGMEKHEAKKIEEMIRMHPEIASVYQQLQEDLYHYSKLDSTSPPSNLKSQILSGLPVKKKPVQKLHKEDRSGMLRMLAVAATLLLLVSLSGLLYSNYENAQLREELSNANKDNLLMDEQLAIYEEEKKALDLELELLADFGTQKYILNDRRTDLKVVAYHNPGAKFAKIDVEQLPVFDQNSDYQLWADIDGEMVSLAVLRSEASSFKVDADLFERASSLNVTLEKAGGSDHATVENLVANISLVTKP